MMTMSRWLFPAILGRSLDIFQNLQRGQPAVCAHDAASGMRGRSAHVEILNWRAVLSPAWHRTQEEELFERELSLEDVALGQSPLAFEIERSDDLLLDDDVFQVRCVLRDRVDHRVAERLFFSVPTEPGRQLVWCVLHEARHHVLAGRCN